MRSTNGPLPTDVNCIGATTTGDGTGKNYSFTKYTGGVVTQLFKLDDLGFLTVAAGITISAFSVAGIVKNNASGVFSSGQVVAAEIASVNFGVILGLPTTLSGYGITNAVVSTTTVTAGAGLTGGGALSSNITLDVGANADGSIVVNANEIQVGILATDAQHGVRGGGALHALVGTAAAGFVPAIGGTSNRVLLSTDHLNATWGQVSDPMISGVGWAKVSGTPTTLVGYGITDAVPSGRTLTGTAPIRIQGDSAAHSLATNLTFSVDGATVVNPGVITLTTDLAGLFNAPTVVQLTGASGIVSVLASTIRFADGLSPAFAQVQAATGSGAKSSWRAQKGATGSQGGVLELGGGDGGTPGTNSAGETHIALGQTVANVSAAFRLQSLTVDVLSIAQTASGVTTFDAASNGFAFAKAIDALATLHVATHALPSTPASGATIFAVSAGAVTSLGSEIVAAVPGGFTGGNGLVNVVPVITQSDGLTQLRRWCASTSHALLASPSVTVFRFGQIDLTTLAEAPNAYNFAVRVKVTVANTDVPNFENTGSIVWSNTGRMESGVATLSIFGGDGQVSSENCLTGRLNGDPDASLEIQGGSLLGVKVVSAGVTAASFVTYKFTAWFELIVW